MRCCQQSTIRSSVLLLCCFTALQSFNTNGLYDYSYLNHNFQTQQQQYESSKGSLLLAVDKFVDHATPLAPNGTLVVFFHLGKTGGTTVRKNLDHNLPNVRYMYHVSKKKYLTNAEKVYRELRGEANNQTPRLLGAPRKTIFFEIHAGNAPSLLVMKETLNSWRKLSKEVGVRFFAFSILREPLSQAISHFNDHCLERKTTCQLWKNKTLVESFLLGKERVNNFQTEFFARPHYTKNPRPYLHMYDDTKDTTAENAPASRSSTRGSLEDAQEVFAAMVDSLDWVGTAECLAEDTFPILQNMVPSHPKEVVKHNVGLHGSSNGGGGEPSSLTKEMLSKSQIDYLHKLMRPDYELYHNATHHFGSKCPSVFQMEYKY